MSTGYKNTQSSNITAKRIAILAKTGETLFHTRDLATLWNIQNKNLLYTTLKRYTKNGLILRIHKGFYSLTSLQKVSPQLLGVKYLNTYAYISTESVLIEVGIITQIIDPVTIISPESKKFSIAINHNNTINYTSRQLADKYLYNDIGITLQSDGYYKASTERAIADMLYFNPKYYFDGHDIINWHAVAKIQKALGYPITQ